MLLFMKAVPIRWLRQAWILMWIRSTCEVLYLLRNWGRRHSRTQEVKSDTRVSSEIEVEFLDDIFTLSPCAKKEGVRGYERCRGSPL